MSTVYERFQALHASGCFVLPNPWDVGSARLLASLGYSALASSSAALAFTQGLPDTPDALELEATLQNLRDLVGATDLPVNADFQSGYAQDAQGVYDHVRSCIETGVAGLSIEDASGHEDAPLLSEEEVLARVRAAYAAIQDSGKDVLLTARCEAFLVGAPEPLRTVLRRLELFADVGAQCLYAPGLQTQEHVREVVACANGRAVNVLACAPQWMTVSALSNLGVRRISVGSAFYRVAWASFRRAAQSLVEDGTMEGLSSAEPFAVLSDLFAPDNDES